MVEFTTVSHRCDDYKHGGVYYKVESNTWYYLRKPIRFCPYCGADLQEELKKFMEGISYEER